VSSPADLALFFCYNSYEVNYFARGYYKMICELTGKGFIDIVFLLKSEFECHAMILEWNGFSKDEVRSLCKKHKMDKKELGFRARMMH